MIFYRDAWQRQWHFHDEETERKNEFQMDQSVEALAPDLPMVAGSSSDSIRYIYQFRSPRTLSIISL